MSLCDEQSTRAIYLYIKLINFQLCFRIRNNNSIRSKKRIVARGGGGGGGGNIMKRNFGKTTGRRLWKYDSRDDNRRVYRVG